MTLKVTIDGNGLTVTPTSEGWDLQYSFELLEKIEEQAVIDGKRFTTKLKEIHEALTGFLEENELSQKVLKQLSDYIKFGVLREDVF